MNSVNVLIITALEKECLTLIERVNPRIKVLNAMNLASVEEIGYPAFIKKLDTRLVEAEVILCRKPPKNIIDRAPKLKWCHTLSAGVDFPLYADILKSKVILTKSSGVNSIQVSEFVLQLILMCAKRAPLSFQTKQKKKWLQFYPMRLSAKTVGIVGLGNIGGEVARLCKAFGMRVIATQKSAKCISRGKYADMILPSDQIMFLLAESDFVILALPATREAFHLIGEEQLKVMKSTAFLINIARGSIIDEEALICALEENWIAGAGLDTFQNEPLPAESRLWDLENVILSCHIAGRHESDGIEATKLFCENLKRYLSGEELLNVVDKTSGY